MQNATMVLYTADVILVGQDEHDMAGTLEALVRHMNIRGWGMHLTDSWAGYLSNFCF